MGSSACYAARSDPRDQPSEDLLPASEEPPQPPPVVRVPRLDLPSSVLTPQLVRLLHEELPCNCQRTRVWRRIFHAGPGAVAAPGSAAAPRPSLQSLRKALARKGPTICVLRSEDGFVFGGFTSSSWRPTVGDECQTQSSGFSDRATDSWLFSVAPFASDLPDFRESPSCAWCRCVTKTLGGRREFSPSCAPLPTLLFDPPPSSSDRPGDDADPPVMRIYHRSHLDRNIQYFHLPSSVDAAGDRELADSSSVWSLRHYGSSRSQPPFALGMGGSCSCRLFGWAVNSNLTKIFSHSGCCATYLSPPFCGQPQVGLDCFEVWCIPRRRPQSLTQNEIEQLAQQHLAKHPAMRLRTADPASVLAKLVLHADDATECCDGDDDDNNERDLPLGLHFADSTYNDGGGGGSSISPNAPNGDAAVPATANCGGGCGSSAPANDSVTDSRVVCGDGSCSANSSSTSNSTSTPTTATTTGSSGTVSRSSTTTPSTASNTSTGVSNSIGGDGGGCGGSRNGSGSRSGALTTPSADGVDVHVERARVSESAATTAQQSTPTTSPPATTAQQSTPTTSPPATTAAPSSQQSTPTTLHRSPFPTTTPSTTAHSATTHTPSTTTAHTPSTACPSSPSATTAQPPASVT
eukprot:gnl/Spiro4/21635_TR10596_c0_g2_i3.p1 gnl/Spiro4/21635_TR10596_c0_g2~~gnl/Spiro4/21635_TR10596_c0_g2_i3.p1  ORF type:complete len:634 (-),score=126.46 gnl/Spiro4/21635_TR10596_c0_g2_i3:24-1925(-)